MIGYYSYTVILTYLSLIFAMAGIHLSFNGMYQWAFICLIMCGICDTFDGMVARSKKNRTDEEKRFGIQIDSLCDLVAFGVFPAILGYNVGLSSIGWLAIEIFYVLAAVIRLAYFNVKEETRQKETTRKEKVLSRLASDNIIIYFADGICFAICYFSVGLSLWCFDVDYRDFIYC